MVLVWLGLVYKLREKRGVWVWLGLVYKQGEKRRTKEKIEGRVRIRERRERREGLTSLTVFRDYIGLRDQIGQF